MMPAVVRAETVASSTSMEDRPGGWRTGGRGGDGGQEEMRTWGRGGYEDMGEMEDRRT